jgi:hypothetical protein
MGVAADLFQLKQSPAAASLIALSKEAGVDTQGLVYLIPVAAIVGVFWMLNTSITSAARVREMKYRERIALIEKGIVPPPEVDPEGFETRRARRVSAAATRFMSGGVTLIGVGAMVGLLISLAAGQPQIGLGVGGGIATLGVFMVVNGWLMSRLAPPSREVDAHSERSPLSPEPPNG